MTKKLTQPTKRRYLHFILMKTFCLGYYINDLLKTNAVTNEIRQYFISFFFFNSSPEMATD